METPVGTGPYKFVKWNKGENVVLVRNDDYWGEKAKTKNVVFRIIADNSARVLALNNGEVDMIDGIDATVVDKIKEGGNKLYEAARHERQLHGVQHHDRHVQERRGPQGRRRRPSTSRSSCRASTRATPRRPPRSCRPSCPASTRPSSRWPTIAEAAKAGLAEGRHQEGPHDHLLEPASVQRRHRRGARGRHPGLPAEGRRRGARSTPSTGPPTRTRSRRGDYDIAFYGWIGDNGDPDNFLNLLADKDPNLNIARWQDPTYMADDQGGACHAQRCRA